MYLLNRRLIEMCAQLHSPATLTQMRKGLDGLDISQDALGKGTLRTSFFLSRYGRFFGLTFLSIGL